MLLFEVRCKKCGRLLGFFDGKGDVKCNKCGSLNKFDTITGESKATESSKKHVSMKNRTTSSGVTFR